MAKLITWEQQHAAGEAELGKVLLTFFKKQNARILDVMGSTVTASAMNLAFRAVDERDEMIDAIGDTLLGLIATGAARVIKQSPRKRKEVDLSDWKLPARVETAVSSVFEELVKQSYWLNIQSNYEASLTDFITDAIKEGLPGPKLAKKLRETMGEMSKVRAAAISRTETTLAYNAGHQASYDSLAEDGIIKGKVWSTVNDSDTRESHADLDGTEVAPGEDFDVGGTAAPYPGHWSLPAEERVNCRCTAVAAFLD